jgi:NAD-dependent SIR2 family protein deacetylase
MSQLSIISFQKILASILFFILITFNWCNELRHASEFVGKYPNFIQKLKNHEFKKIVFLVGAGISTSAGIPDFRSEDGIFNQIKEKYNLDSPEKFFDIDFFYKNPNLFYEFSKEFYSKHYEPTLFHYFMSFINHKNLLYYIFTQNIDNLESKLNIDKEKIIFSHGNLFEASCPKCGDKINFSNYLDYVMNNKVKYCEKCGSPVKSSVIFYGESLTEEFYEKSFDLLNADLIFIAGTNLEVAPFNKLAYGHTNQNSYRIVINKLRVGRKYVLRGLDYEDANSKDIMLIGDCDEIIKMIIGDLGWEKEFYKYYEKMKKK